MDVHTEEGGPAHMDREEGVSKPDFFVDVINGWPLMSIMQAFPHILEVLPHHATGQ